MSPNAQYLVASGTYPPGVRVYDVQELSMKYERRLTAEVRGMNVVWHACTGSTWTHGHLDQRGEGGGGGPRS
jgi:hypothetical protein